MHALAYALVKRGSVIPTTIQATTRLTPELAPALAQNLTEKFRGVLVKDAAPSLIATVWSGTLS